MTRLTPLSLSLVATLACLGSPGRAAAQGSVLMVNGTGEPVNVYTLPRGARAYGPPAFLPRAGEARVSLESPGDYYVVVRDMANADDHLRWYDFHALVRDVPDVRLALVGGRVVVTKQAMSTVYVHVPVTRDVVIPTCELVRVRWPNGCVTYQHVPVHRRVAITEYQAVPVTETRAIAETVFKVDLKATSSAGEVDISKYRVTDEPKK